jgi:hypothetical protein
VYVQGDPRDAADAIEMRRNERGANVQLIGPDDRGVFDGQRDIDELPCVVPVQVYLDLLALPERAREAAEELRHSGELWNLECPPQISRDTAPGTPPRTSSKSSPSA